MASKGKVLLMDDEQIILDVTHEVLKFLGYEVMFARDGVAAIGLYKTAKSEGSPFDLVILDLSVPEGMGGKEAIAELEDFRPFGKSSGVERLLERYGCPEFRAVRIFRNPDQALQNHRYERYSRTSHKKPVAGSHRRKFLRTIRVFGKDLPDRFFCCLSHVFVLVIFVPW